MAAKTLQSNIKQYSNNTITEYALFLSGLNATNSALKQYDPLKTGYARLFVTLMPKFMNIIMPEKARIFKHLIETSFTSVQGIGNLNMDFEQMSGGYAGKQMEIPTLLKDETTAITISLYEQAGSPIREFIEMWLTGISDPQTGIGHYHGALDLDPTLTYSQSNHSSEMFYVMTDPSGLARGIEFACMFANMVPKSVKQDQFNYESGTVQLVKYDIEFSVTKYQSAQINAICKALMQKYQIITSYINFQSGYKVKDINALNGYADSISGKNQSTED